MNTTLVDQYTWKSVLNAIQSSTELSSGQVAWAMKEIMTGKTPDSILAAFLMGLHTRGESSLELEGLAQGMRAESKPIEISSDSVDIVGTGGDQQNTVNISTMSSLVVAGAGIPVVKHGNRASSSSSGSADVLEALGINLNLEVQDVVENFNKVGIAFLFAQVFHPSMRFVAPVRKQLGVPTAFNYLGPLTNPAQPRSSAIGVAKENMAEKLAQVFQARKNQHALIFRGSDGLDEITITGTSQVWETENGRKTAFTLDPKDYGIAYGSLEDLRGGEAIENAEVFREVIAGRLSGPIRDAVLLNSAAAILVYEPSEGRSFTDRFKESMTRAQDSIDSGKAQEKLESWIAMGK